MTWVKGSTTWVNLVDDLTKLACGEMADGNAVTVDPADQWVRETGGQNILKTKAGLDVALGNMSNRAGYWTLITTGFTSNTAASMSPLSSSCRTSNIFTSNPTTSNGRWVMQIRVTVANTVANNYSTANIQWCISDADTGATIVGLSTVTPNSAGVLTTSLGHQVTLAGPNGFLEVNTYWVRTFTTTYVGGIDWWGVMYPRRSGSATFSVNPPGTITTDWAQVDIPCGYPTTPGPPSNFTFTSPRSGYGYGLGIKTNTALTGALYTCTWSVSYQKIRLNAGSGATNGRVNLEWSGGFGLNSVSSTYVQEGGFTVNSWLRPYQTAGSVTNGSNVQYWMRVSADTICIVLNADPAQSGKLTCAWLGAITPTSGSSYDKFPLVCSKVVADYTADNTSSSFWDLNQQFSLLNQKWRQDSSELVNGRDWQTGWMRTDFWNATGGDTYSELNRGHDDGGGAVNLASYGVTSLPNTSGATERLGVPLSQIKPSPWDSNWHLYNIYYMDFAPDSTQSSVSAISSQRAPLPERFVRGHTGTTFLYIPDTAWGNGDELTDSISGKIYFLIGADYHGIGARMRATTNTFVGGVAIRES